MFYIGIDVAKFEHYVSVVDSNGVIFTQPFAFDNNQEGFKLLLSSISQFKKKKHLVGLESTGHYSDNLLRFLVENDFTVGLINPISTNGERKKQIRKTKNDKKDTFLICNVLKSGNYTTFTKSSLLTREAKQLTRAHARFTEELNQHKNRLQKQIDIVFPEFNSIFKTKYSWAYMAILKEFQSAHNIANANVTRIKNVMKHNKRGLSVSCTAKEIKDIAKKSIGEYNQTIELEIKFLIEKIELINQQLSVIDEKIEELANESNSPIFSIPGIGKYTGMVILSEINDINNFSTAAKLIGFAGIDPAVYQSGEYNVPVTAISKRGSTYLRKALYQVAIVIIRTNSTFKSYYTLKRESGKSFRCAQGHVIRKLLRVIFTLLTKNITFDETKIV